MAKDRASGNFSLAPKSIQGSQKTKNCASAPASDKPNPNYKPPATVRKEVKQMATNPPSGDGHRNGAVKQRSQTYNPKTDTWTKRDTDTGKFTDGKKDGTPFKGVRKEK